VLSLPYAAVGSAAVTLRRTGAALAYTTSLPWRAARATWEAPTQIRATYRDRAEQGRRIVTRISDRESAKEAAEQVSTAKQKATGAATSASRAAAKSAEAIEDAAKSAVSPQDTRPYEERSNDELRELAGEREIDGRSSMNKEQLIEALRSAR